MVFEGGQSEKAPIPNSGEGGSTMKRFVILPIIIFLGLLMACGDGGSSSGGGLIMSTGSVSPGGTLPRGTTVTLR